MFSKVFIGFLLDNFHIFIVLSADEDAKNSPFGENATLQTGYLEWPLRVFMSSPFDTLHKVIVESVDPEANNSPVGENARLLT